MICGVLYISSKTNYGTSSKYNTKKFKSWDNQILNVKTKKPYQPNDLYCVVRISDNTVERYIGNVGDRKADEEYLRLLGIIKWSNNKKFPMIEMDIYEKIREDHTHIPNIISIDPPNCEDIDDALHCAVIDEIKQIYEIGIHIADVSSYILENSDLDNELKIRCESIYLASNRIDMLPASYMKACSLLCDQVKRVHSLFIKYDFKNSLIISSKLVHTLIKVKHNMTYEEAELIKQKKMDLGIKLLYDIGKTILSNEYEYNKYDKYDKYDKYSEYSEYDIHKMIEHYMIFINVYVAKLISKNKNGLYRHQSNNQERFVSETTSVLKKKANIISLSKAEYSTDKKSHYHLKLNEYTHFSSPIRRYADVVVHRLTKTESEISKELVDNLNKVQKLNKKIQRKMEHLDVVYKIHSEYNDIFETNAYIISLELNKLYLHIEKISHFEMTIEKKILGDEVLHLIESKKDSNILILTNKISGYSIKFTMFQEIKIKLVTVVTRFNKLKIQIIEPNIKLLTD